MKDSDKTIKAIWNYWNRVNIRRHRPFKKYIPYIKAALEDHSPEEIMQAIDNFNFVIESGKHWWSHRWGLKRFLEHEDGLDNFVHPENMDNYIRRETKFNKDEGEDTDFYRKINEE